MSRTTPRSKDQYRDHVIKEHLGHTVSSPAAMKER